MATYADMQERIARELHRPDLTNEIKDAIKTAIRFYSSQRFVWNEYQWSFSTEPGVKYYSTLTDDVMEIDSVTVTANSRIYQLDPMSYTDMDAIDAGTTPLAGYPRLWSWYAQQIRLYPTPNAVYSINVSGQRNYCDPVADSYSSPWTNELEELIRCRAKADICAHFTYDDAMAQKMYGLESKAFKSLKAQSNKLISSGRISATRF